MTNKVINDNEKNKDLKYFIIESLTLNI